MQNSSVMHSHTSPAPDIMVLGGIGYHSCTPLIRIAGTLNSQRYISEVLEPVVLPYLQFLATAIFQQDNARSHVARIVQRFFVNHQIELFPWPARSPDLSPIVNGCSTIDPDYTPRCPSRSTLATCGSYLVCYCSKSFISWVLAALLIALLVALCIQFLFPVVERRYRTDIDTVHVYEGKPIVHMSSREEAEKALEKEEV
ncbi:uncharacterized protein TNCV_1361391 [Trichonephila clavipes]|nr:uncharacterized protein TNCV_1361391 [Trichonephila clavipes]